MTKSYSRSRKEGWRRFVDTPPRTRPDRLSMAALRELGEDALADYNDTREDWHANFGKIATSQLSAIHADLQLIVRSNRHDPDRVRGAAVIDGDGGLGKSTIVDLFGREFDRTTRRRHGELTDDGDERVPVFRVGLTSNTTLRTLNKMICDFYGHPGTERSSAAQLANHALDCVLACETRVGIIDDVHFIDQNSRDGIAVSNHLKWLANELPVTFIFAGVELEEKGFFDDGYTGARAAMAQTARRWTRFAVTEFDNDAEWRRLVKAIEGQLVLAAAQPGQLAALAGYLFIRTSGRIGSLMDLITRGCGRAMLTGDEALSETLLDTVPIDIAAEKARRRRQARRRRTDDERGAS